MPDFPVLIVTPFSNLRVVSSLCGVDNLTGINVRVNVFVVL